MKKYSLKRKEWSEARKEEKKKESNNIERSEDKKEKRRTRHYERSSTDYGLHVYKPTYEYMRGRPLRNTAYGYGHGYEPVGTMDPDRPLLGGAELG